MRKSLIYLSILALLTLVPVSFAKDNGQSQDNGNHDNSQSDSTGNTNNHNNTNNPGEEGQPGNPGVSNTIQNNEASDGQQSLQEAASVGSNAPIKFGDNDHDELSVKPQSFDQDTDDGNSFTTTGAVTKLGTNSFTLSNGQTFNLTPSQSSFLSTNGTLAPSTQVQVIGNHSTNGNGSVTY